MILNNYKEYRKLAYAMKNANSIIISEELPITLKNAEGKTSTTGYYMYDKPCNGYLVVTNNLENCKYQLVSPSGISYSYTGCPSIHIGSDNTPVSVNDFTLGSQYKPSDYYNITNFVTTEKMNLDYTKQIITYKLYATAKQSMEIKESCLDVSINFSRYSNQNQGFCLLTRNVFETPLTVSEGEDFVITETVEIDLT